MRNILEFPVTSNEVISALQVAFESYTKNISIDGVGSIDGIALLMAEQFISENAEKFDMFVKESMEVLRGRDD